jgi:hypothetical protein
MTKNKALKDGFPPFLNEQSLRLAIESVCAKFGRVTHLEILPSKFGPNLQCACFVRRDSAAAQTALRSMLDVAEFDATLAFIADVEERWAGQRM